MSAGGKGMVDRRALALLLTGEHVAEHAGEVAELLAEGSPLEVGELVGKELLNLERGLAGDDVAEDLDVAAWAFERGAVQLLVGALAARDAAAAMRGAGAAPSSGRRGGGAARDGIWQELAELEQLTADELVHLRRFAAAIRSGPAPASKKLAGGDRVDAPPDRRCRAGAEETRR